MRDIPKDKEKEVNIKELLKIFKKIVIVKREEIFEGQDYWD